MSGALAGMGPQGAALALLLLGHVLADFALQTDRMVAHKHRWGPLLAHGLVVTLVHLLVLAPMLTVSVAGLVLAIGLTHVLVDGVKARLGDPAEASLGLFAGDQLVHVLVLLVVWTQIPSQAWTGSPVVQALDGLPFQAWSLLATGSLYVSAFVFAGHGGNAIVQGLLPRRAMASIDAPDTNEDLGAGGTIGMLERWIVLVLAFAGQWEAIVLVVGAKSLARFEELKSRPFAEYFLVGTLASVLVAVLLALLVQQLA
ncbi:hypothetical protein BRD56_02150 [Thermoplasmatales archaeon SW_10_69_26]|nr:MAG: hypothetical protein BRD56_02150 [Thermoplasmatales archaeon SW_10_69_26]